MRSKQSRPENEGSKQSRPENEDSEQSSPENEKRDKATERREKEKKLRLYKLRNHPPQLGGPKPYYRKELNQQLSSHDGIFHPEPSTGVYYNFYLEAFIFMIIIYVLMFFLFKYYLLDGVPSFDDPEALQEYKDYINGVKPEEKFVHQRRHGRAYRDEL
ncbi:unnamed protein product [Orchesella dallaii]|uniref:Uncharacterized protein n=1 Tax=Orchesella dallaii TaxID=48710 RepID=A0ABP1Q4D3_9HEXA